MHKIDFQQVRDRLAPLSDTPALDAQVLLAHVICKSRTWILAYPEETLSPCQSFALETALLRLEKGEPLPYVLGQWQFFNLNFTIAPEVLIPRPETELLVEKALTWLRTHAKRRWAADVGTGSGCIAVTLAVLIPDLRIIASDVSFQALQVAQANSQKHRVADRVYWAQSDLIPAAGIKYDLICANLPYIPTDALKDLKVYQREPTMALNGGPNGLDLIQRLLRDAPLKLAPGGLLLVEIEAAQGESARALGREFFPRSEIQVLPDLGGKDRMLVIQA